LASAILLCAVVSVILEFVLGRRTNLPNSVVYSTIIVVDLAILIVAAFRVSAMNKRAEEARREIYRQKFEGDLEAIRAWSERRSSSATMTKEAAKQPGLTYEDAGVSIDTMDAALDDVKELVKSTYRPEVLSGMGQFGGLFALDKSKYDDPVLVSSNDSVGTKLKVAFMTGRHNTVGFDIVAHCANDIVVLGAEPLFFLDYIGISKLDRQVMVQVVEGLAAGCREVGCALIGGETAELPSFYQTGEYDLVGSIVGVVDRQKIITGDEIKPGDHIIGMASLGLHTNGFSLARKILFEVCGYNPNDFVQELGTRVGDELLKPHKSYVKSILGVISKFNDLDFKVKGLAHITGGGMLDNIPRILPGNCSAMIEKGTWDMPAVFPFLQEKGNVAEDEMYRVFNMGIGMVIVVSADHAQDVMNELEASGETVYTIGKIVEGDRTVAMH
jgi:phosphoribosylformylglycinamidine cyclo-ligase